MRGAPRKTSEEALLAAALGLFARDGVDSVSVADIAVAAGVAKGTFYRYFASKEALVDALFIPDALALAKAFSGGAEKPRIKDVARGALDFFSVRPLFLSELRLAYRGRGTYRYVDLARGAFGPLMASYFRRDPRYLVSDMDTYSEIIVGAVLDLCSCRSIEGRITTDAEALAMLEDFLKRFFDCEG